MSTLVRPRTSIKTMQRYVPGISAEVLRLIGGKSEAVQLASNENPLGPPPGARDVLADCVDRAHRYPESTSSDLRQALASKFSLTPEHFVVGSGSDEIMHMICQAFLEPGEEAICSETSFSRFRQHAQLRGASVRDVPEVDFQHGLAAMESLVTAKTKILYVVNPNNPTGTYCRCGPLETLIRAVPNSVLILVDEAYFEYARELQDYPETIPAWIRRYPNLLVLRTFSKVYGLAGLRVGYCAGNPDLLSWVERVRLTFNVTLPAQKAAQAALADHGFVRRSVGLVRREMAWLVSRLRRLGFQTTPSAANFLFVKCPMSGKELCESLLRKGIVIRPLAAYGLHEYVRITVGLPWQNQLLVQELKGIMPVGKRRKQEKRSHR